MQATCSTSGLRGASARPAEAEGRCSSPQLRASFRGTQLSHWAPQLGGRRRRAAQLAPPTALFDFLKKKQPAAAARALPTIIPKPSYNIPIVLGGVTAVSVLSGNLVAAGISGVLAAFLGFQASRVKFVFGPEALKVVIGEEQEEFENAFVGGANEWKYDTFTNWEFWWPSFPVLVYFKETQTKPEGQIHFFPVLFDGRQVYEVMAERCGDSQTSLPAEQD